jgi:hypothetical protein
MSNGEFEDRENGLGELPYAIRDERNELFRHDQQKAPPTTRNPGVPNDINDNQRALTLAEGGQIGSPIIPASVTSSYDTRPINGRDFLASGMQTISLPALATEKTTLVYEVRQGFISVLRGFAFYPDILGDMSWTNVQSGVDFDGVTVSLFVSGIAQDGYNALKLGKQMTKFMPTHILASAGQTIKLEISYTDTYINNVYGGLHTYQGSLVEEIPINMFLYGNNLQTRGLPLNFEIATQIKSGSL